MPSTAAMSSTAVTPRARVVARDARGEATGRRRGRRRGCEFVERATANLRSRGRDDDARRATAAKAAREGREDGAGGTARATRARETRRGGERDAIEGRRGEATALEKLDATTETLSFFAMAPLTLLTFPQIWKNYVNVMAGDLMALGAVSWQGYGAGMLGNLLLLSYFADKREPAATAAQAIGVTTSFMLLTQIAWTGNIHNVAPAVMFASSAFIIAGTSLLSLIHI